MEYRRLGKAGIQLSELSFGSWVTFGHQIDDSVATQLMRTALDAGINFFDNAEVYAHGESELSMGRVLKKLNPDRDSYCVSSKVFFGRGLKLPTMRGLHRKHIFEACNQALQRLQVDYLDLFFCHRPDKNTPIEETVWAMHQLVMSGKIFYWGTSEWSAQQITEAFMVARQHHLIEPTMEQPQYNMFHRDRFEVEYARLYSEFGYGTTIWSPLASGLLTGKYNKSVPKNSRLGLESMSWLKERQLSDPDKIEKVKKLEKVAKDLGVKLPQLALAWCLKNKNVSTVITGASRVEQLKENLKAADVVTLLTDDVIKRIEKILNNIPKQPEW